MRLQDEFVPTNKAADAPLSPKAPVSPQATAPTDPGDKPNVRRIRNQSGPSYKVKNLSNLTTHNCKHCVNEKNSFWDPGSLILGHRKSREKNRLKLFTGKSPRCHVCTATAGGYGPITTQSRDRARSISILGNSCSPDH